MMIRLRRLPLIALLLGAVLAMASCGGGAEPTGVSITGAELVGRISDSAAPVIFDVRTAKEYEAGHVPGAINLPHSDVVARVDEYASFKDREVIVYCRSGKRAGMAEADLVAAGFTNVRDLDGHMLQWESDGYPIE